jgi:hypothetical protein
LLALLKLRADPGNVTGRIVDRHDDCAGDFAAGQSRRIRVPVALLSRLSSSQAPPDLGGLDPDKKKKRKSRNILIERAA